MNSIKGNVFGKLFSQLPPRYHVESVGAGAGIQDGRVIARAHLEMYWLVGSGRNAGSAGSQLKVILDKLTAAGVESGRQSGAAARALGLPMWFPPSHHDEVGMRVLKTKVAVRISSVVEFPFMSNAAETNALLKKLQGLGFQVGSRARQGPQRPPIPRYGSTPPTATPNGPALSADRATVAKIARTMAKIKEQKISPKTVRVVAKADFTRLNHPSVNIQFNTGGGYTPSFVPATLFTAEGMRAVVSLLSRYGVPTGRLALLADTLASHTEYRR